MYNDELFQEIVNTPGLNALELAECLGQSKHGIYKRLNCLEKYGVLYTLQEPNPNGRGRFTVKTYYAQPSALKYKR